MILGAVLYVYKGEWGLPSIDFECLRALCLVKFTRFPVDVETKNNPLRSGQAKLPYLKIGCKKFGGYREIKKFLDKEGFSIDKHLDIKSRSSSQAYSEFVFNHFHAYFNYYVYGDFENFDKTRALYANRTQFPFNFFYPATYQREARNIVNILSGFDTNEIVHEDNMNTLLENAKKCLNMLSRILAKKIWFFGEIYSEFDVIVYSYLSILLKISLTNNPLQNHLKCCQNLLNFINRITKDVFKNDGFNTIKSTKTFDTTDRSKMDTEESALSSELKTKIISGVVAVVAMSGFAVWRGIYNQLIMSRSYNGYDDYQEDDDESKES